MVFCRILIEDPEVRAKVMWQDIQLVEPWGDEEVSDDIFSFNPTFLPRDRLSSTQQAVCSSCFSMPDFCNPAASLPTFSLSVLLSRQ